MVSYLTDEYGNKTHAVVPIEEWLKICDQKNKGLVISNYDQVQSSYPIIHLRKILPLVMGMDNTPVDKWKEQYNDYFGYMNNLKAKDIALLYLIRSSDFRAFIRKSDKQMIPGGLNAIYFIYSKDKKPLTSEEVKKLNDNLYSMDEQSFIRFFHENYRFRDPIKKKIRISAEIDRLFIYDVMETYPLYMDAYYKINKDEALSKLMKYVYSDSSAAKTQVQRALREADERINEIDKWEKYLR